MLFFVLKIIFIICWIVVVKREFEMLILLRDMCNWVFGLNKLEMKFFIFCYFVYINVEFEVFLWLLFGVKLIDKIDYW